MSHGTADEPSSSSAASSAHGPQALTINPQEVDAAFETPLAFLMDEANHEIHEREWSGRKRRYYAMPYEDRYIWGATAGMLRNLWERLFR